MKVLTTARLVLITGVIFLAGCTQVNKVFNNTSSVGYKDSKSIPALEVPPDLTTPQYDSTFTIGANSGSVNASTLNPGTRGGVGNSVQVLPDSATVQIKGTADLRWLEIAVPANQLWPRVEGFWATIGAELKRNEPIVGIMETGWIETRGHLPQGFIQRTLGGIFKNATDSGIRDRYTTRFEKTSPHLTRIHITHRGAELVVTETGNKWEMRPRRAAAEAEMLNRLKAYLQGVDPSTVKGNGLKATKSNTVTGLAALSKDPNGRPILNVSDSYERTWIRTGAVINSTGFTLEGQDKAKGFYTVIWEEDHPDKKKGFFRRLLSPANSFLPAGSQYVIQVVKAQVSSTIIRVLDKDGKAIGADTSALILERLRSEFNR